MKTFHRHFGQFCLLIMTAIAPILPAHAATFSTATLNGSYSFLNNLWTTSAAVPEFAKLGVMTFDGAGNVTASYILNSGGVVQSGTQSGTYLVHPDGTGMITFTVGSAVQFAITVYSVSAGVARGIDLLKINDMNNEIVSATAILQSTTPQSYSNATLKGQFAAQGNRWTADPTVARNGYMSAATFDGKGTSTGSLNFVFGGQTFLNNSSTCSYTVNPDGTGFQYCQGGAVIFAFVLNSVGGGGQARGFQFLGLKEQSSGNFVSTGSAFKQ